MVHWDKDGGDSIHGSGLGGANGMRGNRISLAVSGTSVRCKAVYL